MTKQQRSESGGIRISYFLRIPNVGDLINPSLITALTGEHTCHVRQLEEPHLLAIGSIMAGAAPSSQVWGSGVMHPDMGIGGAVKANIHALRGALSYAALRRGGIALNDIALGDPGFLAPALMGVVRRPAPRFRLGIVCHYVDRQNPILQSMVAQDSVADLNVHEPPEVFLGRMADCEAVASTSLHGLIFAEALGIPNLWVRAGDEIGGGDFKYLDWFTTMRRPQKTAHHLVPYDTADALADRAELHDSMIDIRALAGSFPYSQLDALRGSAGAPLLSVAACRRMPMPVFLISFNRGEMLERVIASIKRLARQTDIVVHDNGSTDRATLRVLDKLEAKGTKVVRKSAIASADDLNLVNHTVRDYFAGWAEPARYVVSDCDVDLSVADPLALDVYDELLNLFRRAECVGPMLRIRDIPPTYPLYNSVMNRHIEQFWCNQPSIKKTAYGDVAVQEAPIDTTFALHRAGEHFRRLKSGIRVYEPFEALHLDWYRTDGPNVYTETSNSLISHWDNKDEIAHHRLTPLNYADYLTIKKSQDGSLQLQRQSVSNNIVNTD